MSVSIKHNMCGTGGPYGATSQGVGGYSKVGMYICIYSTEVGMLVG